MALIRLAYAADLPPTDKLVRDLLESDGGDRASACVFALGAIVVGAAQPRRPATRSTARAAPAPQAMAETAPHAAHAGRRRGARADSAALPMLKVHLENDVHLVRLEPGQIEFRPGPRAPRTLAGDLAQKLKDWTGTRWVVTLAREGGAAHARRAKARAAWPRKIEAVAQEPLVRAVLDRFPGAEIVGVHDRRGGRGCAAPIDGTRRRYS